MTKTFSELMREVRASVREVTPAEAEQLAARQVTMVDVREQNEWEEGHVPGAVHVPRGFLESRIEGAVPDHEKPLVLYCAGGVRSALAARQLGELGYRDVVSMSGGFQQWKSEGRRWERPVVLSNEQKNRYSRHMLIPEIGAAGQAKLLESKVLFIGAGGLGSPGLLYLAAAGVGTIGIVDFDTVDLSNLQRQIVHTSDRVGRKKTESAAEQIRALNPDVKVVAHDEMLTDENVARLIDGYDVIIDGTDTFETRYTLNDAAVAARIPVIHASVFRFEGQLTVFKPYEGPCYRCLYPTPPPPELAPGCSVAGVLGVVPGTLGILQATETLKLLLGIGDPLSGRLLIYDALDASFQELKLHRDPACPACGEGAAANGKASKAAKAPEREQVAVGAAGAQASRP
jgi:molybdopterin/thiamine biosynthesis adenylyltransferase/rhodanese-related sulfurtransferase